MPKIRWSNGSEDAAATWEDLLAAVHRLPWNRDYSDEEFRRVLAERAYHWNGVVIDPTLPAEDLFRDLAFAKLVEIVKGTKKNGPEGEDL